MTPWHTTTLLPPNSVTISVPDNMDSSVQPFEAIWLNVNGINSNKSDSNAYFLVRVFLKSKYSIMFLQEPRLKEGQEGQFEAACNWPQSKVQGYFSSNATGSGGVATVVKKDFLNSTTNFLAESIEPHNDECQHVTFSIGTTQFSFANVHMDSHDGARRAALCTRGAAPRHHYWW